MRKLALPIAFGVIGTAILIGLGTWQLQRLEWKTRIIERIEARLIDAPAALPDRPTETDHEYRRVALEGQIGVGELHVLTSAKGAGPGFRVIAPFTTDDGRRILIDRGFVREAEKDGFRQIGGARISGTLLWPDEIDSFTPEPDVEDNLWFARDVVPMARELGAIPILVVVAESRIIGAPPGAQPAPLPVNVNIPNNHLEYVITWYGLALVWAGMSVFWILRLRRQA
ncbi:MAG: SURF1 family protein [Pseudomonadota bacterium]